MIIDMLTEFYDPSIISLLTACRLIPLSKDNGGDIRPIGIGEVMRQSWAKL